MNFAHSEVATLDPNTMRTLCEEYVANNYIDPETSERLGVKRGLRNPDGTGVLAGLTNVCDVVGYKKDQEGHVIPTPGKLIYRGVNINEIVDEAYRNDRFVFEEVIWLLLFGSLPNREQLDDFCEILAEHRALPEGFMDTMNAPSPNIMNKLQRCVLGLYSYDEHAEDLSLENILSQSINLIASMPTMMVNAYQMKRRYYDKQSMFFHLPKPGQSTAEHILSTYRPDQKFTHEEAKLLDMCLLVHADHGGGNCSTAASASPQRPSSFASPPLTASSKRSAGGWDRGRTGAAAHSAAWCRSPCGARTHIPGSVPPSAPYSGPGSPWPG